MLIFKEKCITYKLGKQTNILLVIVNIIEVSL